MPSKVLFGTASATLEDLAVCADGVPRCFRWNAGAPPEDFRWKKVSSARSVSQRRFGANSRRCRCGGLRIFFGTSVYAPYTFDNDILQCRSLIGCYLELVPKGIRLQLQLLDRHQRYRCRHMR